MRTMSVKRDLAANFFGNAWIALVQVAFVPVYIDLLGVEAYGLIGVYVFLQGLLSVLDLGLTPAVSREVARMRAGARPIAKVRGLLRSIEVVFFVFAAVIIGAVAVAARWLAADWLRPETLAPSSVIAALELAAVMVGMRLFATLYRGAVAGSQQWVWLNFLCAGFATLRAVGVIAVLALHAATIEAFFAFQSLATLAEVAMLRARAWSVLASKEPTAFSGDALRSIRRFSSGLALSAALFALLTQGDKLLLSTLVPLAAFGYYMLASALAGALGVLGAPIGAVAYPRLVDLCARGRRAEFIQAFHHFAQLMTLAVGPAALALAFFSHPILALWTRDPAATASAAPLLSVLAIGGMLHAFAALPCMLPVAHGRTEVLIQVNLALVALFLPAVCVGALAHGARGAAFAWVMVNAVGIALGLFVMRREVPAAEGWRWLVADVAAPIAAAAAAAAAVRSFLPPGAMDGAYGAALGIAAGYAAALLAAGSCLPSARRGLPTR
jgi:O-antigen/teichoic acid export membrane protein